MRSLTVSTAPASLIKQSAISVCSHLFQRQRRVAFHVLCCYACELLTFDVSHIACSHGSKEDISLSGTWYFSFSRAQTRCFSCTWCDIHVFIKHFCWFWRKKTSHFFYWIEEDFFFLGFKLAYSIRLQWGSFEIENAEFMNIEKHALLKQGWVLDKGSTIRWAPSWREVEHALSGTWLSSFSQTKTRCFWQSERSIH